jgi:hypothetical protein
LAPVEAAELVADPCAPPGEPPAEEPPPSPPDTSGAPAFAGWLVVPGWSGVGAGNWPVRSGGRFVAIRIVPSEPGAGRSIREVRLKAKFGGGYGSGSPVWRVTLRDTNPADGLFGEVQGEWRGQVAGMIGSGGNATFRGFDVIFDRPKWIVVEEVGSSGFASVNFLRAAPIVGQRHVANDWTQAGKTAFGLDARSVVYGYGYNSRPSWGWYSGSENLVTYPTYVVGLSEPGATSVTRHEGQPFYGGWGNHDGWARWTATRQTTITGVRSTGSGTVTLYKNGAQLATARVGGSATRAGLSRAILLNQGDVLEVRHSGSFPGLAADSVLWSNVVATLTPQFQSDGVAPIFPVE